MKLASVHRYRDHVALYVGNGETVYLTAYEADRLVAALELAAQDVRTYDFKGSRFDGRQIQIADGDKP